MTKFSADAGDAWNPTRAPGEAHYIEAGDQNYTTPNDVMAIIEARELPESVDPLARYRHADGSRFAHPVIPAALPDDDAQRGLYPMAEGCLDYFPNALAEVSRISYDGNQKHNPGEPMHWSRGKSTDHRNKIIRHTVDSRPDTEVAIEHAAQAAWRALAALQEKIERVRGVPLAPGARPS